MNDDIIPEWTIRAFGGAALVAYGMIGVITGIGLFPHFSNRNTPPITFSLEASPAEARVLGAVLSFWGFRILWSVIMAGSHGKKGNGMRRKKKNRR